MDEGDPYEEIKQAALRVYERGLLDGMATTLRLILGNDSEGMEGYPGNLNKSAREWAELRLEAVIQTQAQAWVPE